MNNKPLNIILIIGIISGVISTILADSFTELMAWMSATSYASCALMLSLRPTKNKD
jgi:hypothetical protein